MLELAREKARDFGVEERCEFILADFDTHNFASQFDYSVAMGFMDYVLDPQVVVNRALSLTRRRAFFSFPRRQGFLAWQRRLRYKRKCDLFMYDRPQLEQLFSEAPCRSADIERIARDYFVTAHCDE
jgi:SAM-dependent methyltransferase